MSSSPRDCLIAYTWKPRVVFRSPPPPWALYAARWIPGRMTHISLDLFDLRLGIRIADTIVRTSRERRLHALRGLSYSLWTCGTCLGRRLSDGSLDLVAPLHLSTSITTRDSPQQKFS
ncbi:hypothetical protein LX36DRAFT_218626 [Colletotrichum falcatum]|nr:hypothetical protein LX36DRAFT_218626 [Colletotrichum falcatum]